MAKRRVTLRNVRAVWASGPPPGVLVLELDCQHEVRFAIPALVNVQLAGWVADLLVGTARTCGSCAASPAPPVRADLQSIPLAVDQEEVTKREPVG